MSEQVLAAVRLPRRRGWWWRGLRAAVGLVALAQAGIGVVSLFEPLGLRLGMAAGAHMDHEQAAFNLAFAAALGLVAARPGWARAQVPVLGSFVLVLAVASVFDLAAGAVGWSRLATHAPIVLGLVLAAVLHRMPRPHRGPATTALPGRTDSPSGPEERSGVGEHAHDQPPPPPAAQHEPAAQHPARHEATA